MAKLRKCKADGCEEMFIPRNMQHQTHHYLCAMSYAKELKEKRMAKDKRKAIKEFKHNDKSELKASAQKIFNKYIRLRDKDLPCISCNHTGSRQRHASHYRPVGRNSKHRFSEINVHSACSICNAHLSGNLVPYREAIIKMYGIEKVEELESDNEPCKYSIDELKNIIEKYRYKIKEIENGM